MSSTARESLRPAWPPAPLPTPAEIDAMLQAATVQAVQHDLAPEPALSPEAGWTLAALAAGALAGCLGGGLLLGGWLPALGGTVMGAACGGVFAVTLWRASDGGAALGPQPVLACDAASDDLLSGW